MSERPTTEEIIARSYESLQPPPKTGYKPTSEVTVRVKNTRRGPRLSVTIPAAIVDSMSWLPSGRFLIRRGKDSLRCELVIISHKEGAFEARKSPRGNTLTFTLSLPDLMEADVERREVEHVRKGSELLVVKLPDLLLK